jgi:hypothetical protein
MVERIRKIEGLALEELEAQTLDLLPDREEMSVPAYPSVTKYMEQYNQAFQLASSNTSDHSLSWTGNIAFQNNYGVNK